MNVIQLNTVNLGGDIVVKKGEGGSSGGGSGRTIYVKLDWNNENEENRPVVMSLLNGSLARGSFGDTSGIFPITYFEQTTQSITAYSLNLDDIIKIKSADEETEITLEELLTSQGVDFSSFPLITKEQFYDLTTEI